ncbi:MAG: DUF58 domain-containing protein [Clostridiales bacterium]|jgi:hypothetical protein|nr:DUF58 domain-containing protein [Clostridiales bacterium]
MESLREIFTQEYLNELDTVYFKLYRKSGGGFSGNRRSKSKGSSVEFSDFRSYNKGDDIRRIDWNLYARLSRLFVRVFEEEKQAVINLFIDISKSMDFGEPNKFLYSKTLAASIAYICLKVSDRVNLYTFDGALYRQFNGVSSSKSLSSVIEYLDGLKVCGASDINKAFESADKMVTRGISVMLSDFLDSSGYERALNALAEGSDYAYAVQILAPSEINPEISGPVKLVDSESLKPLDLEIDNDAVSSYKKVLLEYTNELMIICGKKRIHFTRMDTSRGFMEWLKEF